MFSNKDWQLFSLLLQEQEKALKKRIEAEEKLRQALFVYLEGLLRINTQINFTAIRDFSTALWKHIYDSLLFALYLPPGKILDWGTGGGLPGVPLGLWRKYFLGEEPSIVLLDSRKKKIEALQDLLEELFPGLFSFSFLRGEEFIQKEKDIEGVLLRAVAPLASIEPYLSPKIKHWLFFVGPQGRIEYMGKKEHFLKKGFLLEASPERSLPHNLGKRSLIKLSKISP